MKAAKQFRWEGVHRLPWHQGDCWPLHGHSYSLNIELEGKPNEYGMLVNFADIKRLLTTFIQA